MCYRCEVCHGVSAPHEKRKVHRVERKSPSHGGNEIAREVSVCSICLLKLQSGANLLRLCREYYNQQSRVLIPPLGAVVVPLNGKKQASKLRV